MNKLLAVLGAVLIILLGVALVVSINNFELYTDATHANYDEVFDESVPTVYYYYQPDCGYCNSIKDQLTSLYEATESNENVQMRLINLADTTNADGWYDFDALYEEYGDSAVPTDDPNYITDPALMKTIDDIKITGTPAMIYVADGEVVGYAIGKDVFTIMESVNTEFELGLTFDSSKYGE